MLWYCFDIVVFLIVIATTGEKALARIKRDENLQGWFNNLATEIGALEFERPILTGRKVSCLVISVFQCSKPIFVLDDSSFNLFVLVLFIFADHSLDSSAGRSAGVSPD
jgi:hypothetical protein